MRVEVLGMVMAMARRYISLYGSDDVDFKRDKAT